MSESEPKQKRPASRIFTNGVFLVAVAAALVLGIMLGKWGSSSAPPAGDETAESVAQNVTDWTCAMDPQIHQPHPGKCPICGMDLIPTSSGDSGGTGGMRHLTVSENAARLMDIETFPVERRFVTANLRMVGKVDYDETRLAYLTAWVPGRLDRLFVDYTGVPVQKGDHMVSMYSPELYHAQEELLQAIKRTESPAANANELARQSAEGFVESVRQKLRLLGLTPEQIIDIEKSGKVADHLTIYAPIGGIVIHKNALVNDYVKTGTRIYTIADLSQVWVKLDAYESDLQWLRYGQKVKFTTVSYPGEVFTGAIAFIDPILNQKTRTSKVRVNVANPDGRLKPGMFVTAQVEPQVALGGKVMDPDLAGKWICPMHPEIIKEHADTCDICQMPLVTTESQGYVSADPANAEKPLVIPVTAALVTGKRAVVYVKAPQAATPTFEGREIVLGPRAGDYYLVSSGLKEGEEVVTRGNFKIDSALQLQAKPSMMSPAATQADDGPDPEPVVLAPMADALRPQLDQLFGGYFAMQQSLAGDQAQAATQAVAQTLSALNAIDENLIDEQNREMWQKAATDLENTLKNVTADAPIETLRQSFHLLSQQLIRLGRQFGSAGADPYYVFHCPMAFNNTGANWLQSHEQIHNPYFGYVMPKCGALQETLPVAATLGEDR